MKFSFFASIVIALTVLVSACTKPTTIGSELLEDDQANLLFTDSFSMVASTVKEDSLVVYDPDVTFSNMQVGYFEDPIFGQVKAGFYFQVDVGLSTPALSNPTLDSIVLTMVYDSSGVYGTLEDMQELEVYRIVDDIDNGQVYYSNQVFQTESTPIGTAQFIPAPNTDVEFPRITDTLVAPHIRIVLDPALGQELLDSMIYENDFVETLNGLFVTTASTQPTDAMLNFDMVNTLSRVNLFYTNDDTLPQLHQFLITGISTRMSVFEHDFSGSTVEPFIDNTALGDSLLFVQSMSGTNVKLEFPYLQNLGNVLINKAELEFTVAEIVGSDLDTYPAVDRLLLSEQNEEGEFRVIRDIIIGPTAFGGQFTEGDFNNTYSMNVSAQIQDIVDGTENPEIFIRAFGKQENANRVVLYGPNHPDFSAKLKITYTDLN